MKRMIQSPQSLPPSSKGKKYSKRNEPADKREILVGGVLPAERFRVLSGHKALPELSKRSSERQPRLNLFEQQILNINDGKTSTSHVEHRRERRSPIAKCRHILLEKNLQVESGNDEKKRRHNNEFPRQQAKHRECLLMNDKRGQCGAKLNKRRSKYSAEARIGERPKMPQVNSKKLLEANHSRRRPPQKPKFHIVKNGQQLQTKNDHCEKRRKMPRPLHAAKGFPNGGKRQRPQQQRNHLHDLNEAVFLAPSLADFGILIYGLLELMMIVH